MIYLDQGRVSEIQRCTRFTERQDVNFVFMGANRNFSPFRYPLFPYLYSFMTPGYTVAPTGSGRVSGKQKFLQ